MLALLALASAARADVNPTVSGTPDVLGTMDVLYPSLTRDSCGSVRFGQNELWVCRDTQEVVDDVPTGGIVANTAGWSYFDSDGTPQTNLSGPGTMDAPFYPIASDECGDNTAGLCADGSRYAIWPDSPPVVTTAYPNGFAQGYTWVIKSHINSDLSAVKISPATSLYRVTYSPDDGDSLPTTAFVDEEFWPANSVPWGDYGNVVNGSFLYVYGALGDDNVAVGRVNVSNVEDASAYEFYVGGSWTGTAPALGDASAAVANAGNGGQGTFYYSDYWSSFVWIGGSPYPGATFNIATAPNPEGPWTTHDSFYSGVEGNSTGLTSYSLQAHPGLTDGTGKDIYISYTKCDETPAGDTLYSTPLIHVVWA